MRKMWEVKLSNNNVNFGDISPLLLTDNGGEFAYVFSFENHIITGERETALFFCDPYGLQVLLAPQDAG